MEMKNAVVEITEQKDWCGTVISEKSKQVKWESGEAQKEVDWFYTRGCDQI